MLDLGWILDRLPVGLWVAEAPSGRVTYANPEFRAILGMDAVPDSTIADASATYGIFDRMGSPYPVDKLPFSRVVSTAQPTMVDDIVIHRIDGPKVNVRAFAYPKFDNDGKLTHVIVAFVDITPEVKAEVEREQIEARLAIAVNHAPIVIWATDAHGVVTLSEGAGLVSLGLKSGQLVGQNLFELYRDHPSIPGFIRRGLAGESFSYTVNVGEVVYDTWLTPIRNAAGEITGVAGLSNDVSEIRRLQAHAIQNDRIIALGTLAASVAHEINNPLTYILGNLDLLGETLARMKKVVHSMGGPAKADLQTLSAEVSRDLETVHSGAERIAAITKELQTFSRSGVKETSLVNVGSVVQSVLKLMGKDLDARAHVEVKLETTAPVLADFSRLVQVVMNLVVNALHALGTNRPDSNTIWIGTRDAGSNVLIEVADSGPGVPPEDRERIFDPFVTTKGIGKGTGLGLFVCRNIVREFSGHVRVSDRPGGGAVFCVELPAAASIEISETQGRGAAAVLVRAEAPLNHVLIIDDEALIARVLSDQLGAAGYRTSVELDPVRALETLSLDANDIDLVYCDLMMQAMSGMELADALSARSPFQLQKFVFMTAGAFTPEARAFRERYAEQCVDKPFNIVEETARRLDRRSRNG
jgi:PAS domain S-box-containing protein